MYCASPLPPFPISRPSRPYLYTRAGSAHPPNFLPPNLHLGICSVDKKEWNSRLLVNNVNVRNVLRAQEEISLKVVFLAI